MNTCADESPDPVDNVNQDPHARYESLQMLGQAVIELAVRDMSSKTRLHRISARLFFESNSFIHWCDICGADHDAVRSGIYKQLSKLGLLEPIPGFGLGEAEVTDEALAAAVDAAVEAEYAAEDDFAKLLQAEADDEAEIDHIGPTQMAEAVIAMRGQLELAFGAA